MAIGSIHKKFGEDQTGSSRHTLMDRQTHTDTDRHGHHYTLLLLPGAKKKGISDLLETVSLLVLIKILRH